MADISIATPDDAAAVFELLAARSRAAFGVSELSWDVFSDEFRRESTDRWVAHQGDELVGYAHLGAGHELVCAAADPEVGDALVAVAEQRARERGFDTLEITAVPEDAPLWSLAERNGFEHTRDVLRMWRVLNGELAEPQWAEGVAVRTYTDSDGERVHALLDASYSAWDETYVPLAHDAWLTFMTDHGEFDPAMWFLAERDGELVACALHWKEHQRRGWVKDIVVQESERGRGLAKALLHHAFREYASRGAERVGLKVDSTNPTGAPQLYERVGFEIERRYAIWERPL